MKEKPGIRKWKAYTIIAVLFIAIGFLVWDGCQSRQSANDFETQMAQLDIKAQGFRKTIDERDREIAEQNQIILTKEQALQQGMIEYTKLKKIKAQIRVITKTKIEKEFIPFTDPDEFDDIKDDDVDLSKYISVPKPFTHDKNEWYWIGGRIIKGGIEIDSITFFNSQIMTIGEKREKGLKNLFKPMIPTVEIINLNEYTSIHGMENIVIKAKEKKFYQTTGFKFFIGFITGTTLTIWATGANN